MINKKFLVIVAMSGGVDSSVAAALLKKAGFDVVGVFMKFWHEPYKNQNDNSKLKINEQENHCCSIEAQEDARRVAAKIGIPFYTLNLEKEFKKEVVDYFLKEYKAGRTPNPCVVCNKEIKFGLLLKKAMALKADFVATGHYARISFSKRHNKFSQRGNFCSVLGAAVPSLRSGHRAGGASEKLLEKDIRAVKLLKAKDKKKDQSYFLWTLTQDKLAKVLFPIGDFKKVEVRKMAKKWGLPTAQKPESQEICFIPDNNLKRFLKGRLKIKKGPIVNTNGDLIGKHQGLALYTIGQRKGIGIGAKEPYFVVDKNYETNTLIVTSLSQKDALSKKELIVKNVNWISGKESKMPLKIMAKIRYRQKSAKTVVSKTKSKRLKLVFNAPQRAMTPGQSVVFYKGNELLGGGIIR